MKKYLILLICVIGFNQQAFTRGKNVFPDGTKIPKWFLDSKKVELKNLGKVYDVTAYGALQDSLLLQTSVLQKVIDEASQNGGGVVLIPKGVFLTGALFFKPKTHLHVAEGAVLKGSDNIADYPLLPSRMEGQNLDYYSALINAYGVDGFTISGKGTINGNGLKFWQAFWQRRKENPKCTNLEVSRPRLVFVWKCNDVQFQDVNLINSGFWTNHFYQCNNVKLIDLTIFAPRKPVPGPSTDAVDIDVCNNVLVKGCHISVNDDGVVVKGGKGPWADQDPNNGKNTNVLVEDCHFGFCHAVLTCGSESIHNKNILMRNCTVEGPKRLLCLKMRPDTPQKYEYITVENVTGWAGSLLDLKPWTQFFDLKGRTDLPVSLCENITLRNIQLTCDQFVDAKASAKYQVKRFTFDNVTVITPKGTYDTGMFLNATYRKLKVIAPKKETAFKFDFGSGAVQEGYQKVDARTLYSKGMGYGFDFVPAPKAEKYGKDKLKGNACVSDRGFFFSIDVPEGNYRVKLLLGNASKPSLTTVRGESRRLFLEKVATQKGEFKEVSFTTNVRYVEIDATEKVKIKEREKNKANWDHKLTIEFNDAAPSVCAMEVERIEDATTVFLCGNSTVVDQDNEPWCGWGQMIPRFFTDKIAIANYAESGESASSFISAGRLKKILTKIKPSDYVFVEFGHNDQKQKGPNDGAWASYTTNMKKFITETRAKGGIPVLVTSMHRRSFDTSGFVINTLGEYPDAVRKLASDEQVALIDLNVMSKILYEAWGPTESVKAFVHYPANTFPNQPKALADNTHFNSYGGYELAKCMVEGIKKSVPALAAFIRSDYAGFDPAHPDPAANFSMPQSPFMEVEKPDGN